MDYSPTTSLCADIVPLSSSCHRHQSPTSKYYSRRPSPPPRRRRPHSCLDDHVRFMREQESSHHYGMMCDYLKSSSSSSSSPLPCDSGIEGSGAVEDTVEVAVTPEERKTMILWSYGIVDACSIDREIACIAASYFDRFMSIASTSSSFNCTATSCMRRAIALARDALSSRKSFQLVYIVCLVISLKCRGGINVDADFVSDVICRGRYTSVELNITEMNVLVGLGWRLNGPSPHEFVDGMLHSMTTADEYVVGGGDIGTKCDLPSSLSMLASSSKTWVEECMLDYDASISTLPSSLAQDAIQHALRESPSNENTASMMYMNYMFETMKAPST